MINKQRYEELENEYINEKYTLEEQYNFKNRIQERIQTDWENNKEQLDFLIETYGFPEHNLKNRVKKLEEDKKFIQELANKYGVELE